MTIGSSSFPSCSITISVCAVWSTDISTMSDTSLLTIIFSPSTIVATCVTVSNPSAVPSILMSPVCCSSFRSSVSRSEY